MRAQTSSMQCEHKEVSWWTKNVSFSFFHSFKFVYIHSSRGMINHSYMNKKQNLLLLYLLRRKEAKLRNGCMLMWRLNFNLNQISVRSWTICYIRRKRCSARKGMFLSYVIRLSRGLRVNYKEMITSTYLFENINKKWK